MVCTRVFVLGSMRETESSPVFVTQSEPLSAATEPGDDPTGTEAAIRPDPESIAPTESGPTPASAVSPEPPPSAKTGIATAAAITPASAASQQRATAQRRLLDLLGAAERRELDPQPLRDHLRDPLGPVHVLQAVRAEIAKEDAGR